MRIEIKGLERLVGLAERYPQVAEKHVNRAISNSLIRIQDEAKKNAPFGTSGNLRQNWSLSLGRFRGSLSSAARSSGYPYGSAVEYGTSPHYVNPMALDVWARRRGLNPYAVAMSIRKKGTRANPFFRKSVDAVSPKVDDEFSRAIDAILKEI